MPDYRTMGQRLLAEGALARDALERKLQSVATDLMFGADPSDLVARLIELGAPPAEAERIIRAAEKDPLIANGRAMAAVLRKRDWLLEAIERQQRLWPEAGTIERRSGLSGDQFLERYYSRARPVILAGELRDWPAIARWTPRFLAETIGGFEIQYRGVNGAGQDVAADRMPFDAFVRGVSRPEGGTSAYLLSDELSQNVAIAGWLKSDLGFLPSLLDLESPASGGTLWIGGADILTPLHHDLVNCLVAQIVGRNRFKIVAAGDVAKMYNRQHVASEIADLDAPGLDAARYPGLAAATIHDVTLEPGEVLFLPLAWWYQVRSIGFGVSVTYTNFRWPNDAHRRYPAG